MRTSTASASSSRSRPSPASCGCCSAPTVVDRPGAIDLVDCIGDVRFDSVGFAYGDGANVLTNFSLHLAPGETVAMVGRTGSGKTTVSRLLGRFYDVTEGAV